MKRMMHSCAAKAIRASRWFVVAAFLHGAIAGDLPVAPPSTAEAAVFPPQQDEIATQQSEIAAARDLYLRGRYAEAAEAFEALLPKNQLAATLGLARCEAATGEASAALSRLDELRSEIPDNAELAALLAELQFTLGEYDNARDSVTAALAADSENLSARWIDAELHRVAGKLDDAATAYDWFITYYNRTDQQQLTADDLRYIGLAAAQFARWNRAHEQFNFLVNTLYPDALAADKNFWPAHLETARLFIEKYNTAEAAKPLDAALRINPNAAEVHAARGQLSLQTFDLETAQRSLARALEINPQLAEAHRLLADVHLANFEPAAALTSLKQAFEINPKSEDTLGRLAAVYLIGQGIDADQAREELEQITAAVQAANPQAGRFAFTIGETLSAYRRWPQAVEFYEQAARVMPQLIGPKAALGLVQMRLGQEAEARETLEAAFEEDPFNVRVKNMLEVLDVLDSYATAETEHFTLKYDAEHDQLLAAHLGHYMESVYPELCGKFDFHPDSRSLFEIFNQARNTSGHGWFSARMVGLPYVGTVGACAGQMVAITSPNSMNAPFNWARVAKHEFVHVLNLQQTNFNVPHWFTEGLAVEAEGYPRMELWDQLLASRVSRGETFDLGDINFGFLRPASQHEWHLAYCQAELYVQFMREEFSEDRPAAMLQAYADNLTTPQAIEHCFGVSQAEFEARYRKYIEAVANSLPKSTSLLGEAKSFAEIDRAARANPRDPDKLAELAEAYLNRQEYANARRVAERAIEFSANHAATTYVLARLELVTGEVNTAEALLETAYDVQAPHAKSVRLLASIKARRGDHEAAAALLRDAQSLDPANRQWSQDLATVYLQSGDDGKLAEQLEILALADSDQLNFRKKLASIAFGENDYATAARWSRQAVWIDVNDSGMQRVLAVSSAELSDWETAELAYRSLSGLEQDNADWPLGQARSLIEMDKRVEASEIIRDVLERFPDNIKAAELLQRINGSRPRSTRLSHPRHFQRNCG